LCSRLREQSFVDGAFTSLHYETRKCLIFSFCIFFYIEEFTLAGEGAFFNDNAHFCNTNSSHCFAYHPKSQLWLPSDDLSTARAFGAFALLPTRCQFHQHFTCVLLYSRYVLDFAKVQRHFHTKNAHLKC